MQPGAPEVDRRARQVQGVQPTPEAGRASNTVQSTPAVWRALATVNPAMPAPTTSTRPTGPVIPPGISALPSSKSASRTMDSTSDGEPRRLDDPRIPLCRSQDATARS